MGFLNPESYVEGGLLLDNVIAVMRDVQWQIYDYEGKQDPAVVLKVHFEVEGTEGRTEYYRIGTPDQFAPSDDGMTVEPIGDRKQINKSSKGAIFLGSLVASGFDGALLDSEPISCITDMKVHVIGQDPPKSWSNMNKDDDDDDGKKRKYPIFVVDDILEEGVAAGSKKPSRGSGKKPAKKKTSKKRISKKGRTAELDLNKEATEAITKAVESSEEGSILATDIADILSDQLEDHPHKTAIISHAFKESFFSDEDRPWVYDGDEGEIYFTEE